MTKTEMRSLGLLLLIFLPIAFVMWIADSLGWVLTIILAITVVIIVSWIRHNNYEEKLQYLTEKYKDKEIVEHIMNHLFWQGQNSEQLLDSLGQPADIEQKILKTKKKEVWKYHAEGSGRFRLRIVLEDDRVVGWKQR